MRAVLVLAVLSFAALPFVSAQSLADVAKKEKQRRSTDTKASGDDVIDEYTLAGYKDVKTVAASKSDGEATKPQEGASEEDGETVGTESGANVKPDDLETRAKRACAQKPDGIVCASLKKKLQKAKQSNRPKS